MSPERIKDFEALLEQVPGRASFRIPDTEVPWSITPYEGRALYETARLLDLARTRVGGNAGSNAIEIATAFGYSAAWIALGLAHGRLLTIDPYTEERSQSDHTPAEDVEPWTDGVPRGLELAREGARLVGAEDRVYFHMGYSPKDVPSAIMDTLGEGVTFDLAFIDGHHLNEQPTKDWHAIAPYLSKQRSVVFFHDTHVACVRSAMMKAEAFFGHTHVHAEAAQGFGLLAYCGEEIAPIVEVACRSAKMLTSNPYLGLKA